MNLVGKHTLTEQQSRPKKQGYFLVCPLTWDCKHEEKGIFWQEYSFWTQGSCTDCHVSSKVGFSKAHLKLVSKLPGKVKNSTSKRDLSREASKNEHYFCLNKRASWPKPRDILPSCIKPILRRKGKHFLLMSMLQYERQNECCGHISKDLWWQSWSVRAHSVKWPMLGSPQLCKKPFCVTI